MRRAAVPGLLALLCSSLAPSLALAEVTREAPIVDKTGYTLREGEWKIGLLTSSYGITDRLQVDSALLLTLAVQNAGLKYRLVDAPNLALSLNAYGGGSAASLFVASAVLFGGARVDASMPVHEQLSFNLSGGWQIWSVHALGMPALFPVENVRVSWFHLEGSVQYVYQPRHVFFVTMGTPTSWHTVFGPGAHDFDGIDFWQGAVGYQYSRGIANLRVDLGWGPSLLGRGPTASLDFYLRFD